MPLNLEAIKEQYSNMDWKDFRENAGDLITAEIDIYNSVVIEGVPALIAEVERQNEELEQTCRDFYECRVALSRQKEENERLRAALEFYGDIENYQLNKIGHGFLSPIVMADGGNKARKAVRGKKLARTPEENALIDKVIANLQALDGDK